MDILKKAKAFLWQALAPQIKPLPDLFLGFSFQYFQNLCFAASSHSWWPSLAQKMKAELCLAKLLLVKRGGGAWTNEQASARWTAWTGITKGTLWLPTCLLFCWGVLHHIYRCSTCSWALVSEQLTCCKDKVCRNRSYKWSLKLWI